MGAPLKKYELVARAINEIGSTDTGKVALQIEDILHNEMINWPSYKKLSPRTRYDALCKRLERYQIYTSGDIRRLIAEVRQKKLIS